MSNNSTIIIVGASFAGLKTAWDLRHKLSSDHRILVFSNKPTTTIRASFPRVVFEDVKLEDITIDLAKNFEGTGIEFICDPLVSVDQENDVIVTAAGRYEYDFLVLATGARHAYDELPGSREFALSVCDPARIMETKEALLNFTGGDVYGGVGAGYTPCDGPPMEMLMDLDHRLRMLGLRDKANLHYFTDKGRLLPPGGPQVWERLECLFREREIHVHLNVDLVRLDSTLLHFKDGATKPYDLCLLIPPYRGIHALEGSGLTDARGFVPVSPQTMRADKSTRYNVYAVGDAIANPGPKQGHLALIQAGVAAAHLAWRITGEGTVPAYLPEFKCVMDLGGGHGLYMYSQWLSDGSVVEIQSGPEPYASKIRFEEMLCELRGDIGDLHLKMIK